MNRQPWNNSYQYRNTADFPSMVSASVCVMAEARLAHLTRKGLIAARSRDDGGGSGG